MARYDYSNLLARSASDNALREKLDYVASLMRFYIQYPDYPAQLPAYGVFADCYDELIKRGILIANDEYKKFRIMAELERR